MRIPVSKQVRHANFFRSKWFVMVFRAAGRLAPRLMATTASCGRPLESASQASASSPSLPGAPQGQGPTLPPSALHHIFSL